MLLAMVSPLSLSLSLSLSFTHELISYSFFSSLCAESLVSIREFLKDHDEVMDTQLHAVFGSISMCLYDLHSAVRSTFLLLMADICTLSLSLSFSLSLSLSLPPSLSPFLLDTFCFLCFLLALNVGEICFRICETHFLNRIL